MELTKQVVSLELAKRLKELGVKQESYFSYLNGHLARKHYLPGGGEIGKTYEKVSAFTVAELGEKLPWEIGGWVLDFAKGSDGSWAVFYRKNTIGCIVDPKVFIEDQGADTEADARAKCLIYLLENSLIPLPING